MEETLTVHYGELLTVLQEGGQAMCPPYRDLGEDVDEKIQHSQGDGDPPAPESSPEVFRHRGYLGVKTPLSNSADFGHLPPQPDHQPCPPPPSPPPQI